MKKGLMWISVVALGIGLLVAGVRYVRRVDAALGKTTSVGRSAGDRPTIKFVKNSVVLPESAFEDIEGHRLSTSSWPGKVTIYNFWATWCLPCRTEIPDFVALQAKYRDRLQIVGVSLDEGSIEDVRRFAVEHQVNYPIVMATAELKRHFPGVFAIPTSFLVDRQLRTVQKHVGVISSAIWELEVRVLSGLPTDAVVETVDDAGQVLLANAALATEIPGLDLSQLAPLRKQAALQRLNTEKCTCGCDLTLAQCRINDSSCEVSLPLAKQLLAKLGA